jgi:hypothetical protein
MELAVVAALVLAHHADRQEAGLLVAADRPPVGRRRVDGDPVMPPPFEQEPGKQADGLRADAFALVGGTEEDVDARVPVHRVFLLVILDAPAMWPATSTTRSTLDSSPASFAAISSASSG